MNQLVKKTFLNVGKGILFQNYHCGTGTYAFLKGSLCCNLCKYSLSGGYSSPSSIKPLPSRVLTKWPTMTSIAVKLSPKRKSRFPSWKGKKSQVPVLEIWVLEKFFHVVAVIVVVATTTILLLLLKLLLLLLLLLLIVLLLLF